jgi:hypothetical protein
MRQISDRTSFLAPRLELVFDGLGSSQFAASRELTGELAWCPLSERSVRTTLIVQVGYRTPIKPTSEKCSMSGIRGAGCRYTFAAMHGEGALSFFVARAMS